MYILDDSFIHSSLLLHPYNVFVATISLFFKESYKFLSSSVCNININTINIIIYTLNFFSGPSHTLLMIGHNKYINNMR